LGVFYVSIIRDERRKTYNNLSDLWMGNHLNQEGLRETLQLIDPSRYREELKPKKVSQKEINKSWKRLMMMQSKVGRT